MDFDKLKTQIGERLGRFIESTSMNKSQFAECINFNSGALYTVLRGKNGVSMEMALAIKNKFPDLSLDWLFTGEGQMAIKNSNIVIGENNGTMQINNSPSPEVLAERVRALERELQLKDEIISLLKK